MTIVSIEGASFRRDGRVVLTDVSFEVAEGEAVALVGPNGAGKSTLLDGLLGLVPHDAKRFEVPALGTEVGVLPQTTALDPAFPVTLRQVVAMGRTARLGLRWPGRRDRGATQRALEAVRLEGYADHRFGDLSGGQQQRGLLARALAAEPKLLLLDEPFNGLDAAARRALLEVVEQLKERGIGFVIATHDLDLARAVCERTLLIDREQIAFDETACVLTLEQVERAFGAHAVEIDGHTLATTEHHATEHGHADRHDRGDERRA